MMKSLSVVVPALNEEAGLGFTLDEVLRVLGEGAVTDFEILIFNDGSTDRTGEIAENYARMHREIRVLHNATPQGIGSSYKRGIGLASKEYYVLIHGDYETDSSYLKEIIRSESSSHYYVTHVLDDTRPLFRRIVSRSFTLLVNTLFGLHFKYYNGPNVIPLALLKGLPVTTEGHAYMAETIVRLHHRGYTRYNEIGYYARRRLGGKNKAFAPRNIFSVVRALIHLKRTLKRECLGELHPLPQEKKAMT